MKAMRWMRAAGCAAAVAATGALHAYPLDGFEETGIRRLEAGRLAEAGTIRDGKQPPGRSCRRAKSTCACAARPSICPRPIPPSRPRSPASSLAAWTPTASPCST